MMVVKIICRKYNICENLNFSSRKIEVGGTKIILKRFVILKS